MLIAAALTLSTCGQDAEKGFERYMGWVSGHQQFKQLHPKHEAYVVDIEWLTAS